MERHNRADGNNSNNNSSTNESNPNLNERNSAHGHQSSTADYLLNADEILGTFDELTRSGLFSPLVQLLRSNGRSTSSGLPEQNAECTTTETQNAFPSTLHRPFHLQQQQQQQQQTQWNQLEDEQIPISEASHSADPSGINPAAVSAETHLTNPSGINQDANLVTPHSAYPSGISKAAESIPRNSNHLSGIALQELVKETKTCETPIQSLNFETDLIDLVSSESNIASSDAVACSSQSVAPAVERTNLITNFHKIAFNDQIPENFVSSHVAAIIGGHEPNLVSPQECVPGNFSQFSSTDEYDHRLNHSAHQGRQVLQDSSRPHALKHSNGKCLLHPKYPTRMYCLKHRVAVCCFCCISTIGPHSHENLIPVPKYNTGVDGEKWHEYIKYLSLIVENAIYKFGFWFNINVPVEKGENGHLVFKTSFSNTDTFTMTPDVKSFLERLNRIINTISVYETCHTEFGKEIKAVLHMFITMPEFAVIKPKVHNIPTLSAVPVDVSKCYVVGQGTKEMIAGYQTRFFVVTKDPEGNPCDVNKIPYSLSVEIAGKRVATGNGPYYKKGVIEILLKHDVVQECLITIKINNECVPGTPLNVTIRPCTNFFKEIHLKTNLTNAAAIANPFGSCIDWKSERIYISDQGSNSITVYTLSPQYPKFKYNFTGSLKKPTGVAIDLDENLVVCDQGNDRLQVFTPDGHQIRESSSNIKLKKPWYVAVNSKNEYIVTHSDCVVAIMTSTFTLVQELRMPGGARKGTALRGLCTSFLDDIFVTDLASGNVYVVDTDTGNFELAFANCRRLNWDNEYFVPPQPQSISIDRAGYIIISDFSNMCVDVYTHSGDLLSTFVVDGNPTSVVPLESMSQYVVTMANGDNKVQVFEHMP